MIGPSADEFNVIEGCSLALSLFDNYGGDLEGSCNVPSDQVTHYMMRKSDNSLFYFSGYKLTVGELGVDASSGVPVFSVPLQCPDKTKITLRRTMLNDKVSQVCKASGTKLDVWVALATHDSGSIEHSALFVEHQVGNDRRIRTLLMPDGGAMPKKSIAQLASLDPNQADAAKGELRHIISSIRVMAVGKDEVDGTTDQTLVAVRDSHDAFVKEQALSASHERVQSIHQS